MGHMIREEDMRPVNSVADIPDGMSEDEEHEFWSTHYCTEEFFENTPEVPEEERPHPRPRD